MIERVYGLTDRNSFYAGCERVFCPDLVKTPIVVLSNNDSCVIARSCDAKPLVKRSHPSVESRFIESALDNHRYAGKVRGCRILGVRPIQTCFLEAPPSNVGPSRRRDAAFASIERGNDDASFDFDC